MAAPLTSADVLAKLKSERLAFYALLRKNAIRLPLSDSEQTLWTNKIIREIRTAIKHSPHNAEEPACNITHINNRRYLGNKYKLLDFITQTVTRECPEIETVADIFSGTGSVASAFQDQTLITNDILYMNYLCHLAWFGAEHYDEEKVRELICFYNAVIPSSENYMSLNFADTFFSYEDCKKIGFIRDDIEQNFKSGKINPRERAILITSLIYAMDKIANTCGHYDAYIRGTEFDKHLELAFPQARNDNNPRNQCFNEDANLLVRRIQADLVYIDPPYNSRQYCDTYHLLENVARWEKPAVSGVALKMDRSSLKSDYCTLQAAKAFEDLIAHIQAKYILFSYNNMGEKGNGRSNAKISDDDIMRILSQKGKVRVFSADYRPFSAGKSNISDHSERLFLCECHKKVTSKSIKVSSQFIQSPLNYTGGKYRLLPQLIPLFPTDIHQFVDLFCGGGNVGINVSCPNVLFNDKNPRILALFQLFKKTEKEYIFQRLEELIEKYGLSDSEQYGYEYYHCSSSEGLGAFNGEKFLKLRRDFNSTPRFDDDYFIMFFLLIIFSFNNQIRFNRKGEFNLPVGKRDFNKKMRQKLSLFMDRLKSGHYQFENKDFRDLSSDDWEKGTFVYVDPPYLITCASYNEQGGWDEDLERELLLFLDSLHQRGIRFALSNLLRSKGKENKILIDWIQKNRDEYRLIQLDYHYANANYHTKDKSPSAEEILVVNY